MRKSIKKSLVVKFVFWGGGESTAAGPNGPRGPARTAPARLREGVLVLESVLGVRMGLVLGGLTVVRMGLTVLVLVLDGVNSVRWC